MSKADQDKHFRAIRSKVGNNAKHILAKARSARHVRARARAPKQPVPGLIGAGLEEDHEEGDDEHLCVAGVVVAGLDEPLARRGDGRQKFFSCAGARASVSAPRAIT